MAVPRAAPPSISREHHMKPTSIRLLPLVAALSLSFGVATAQTTGGTGTSGSAGTGSSMTGGRTAPAAQPGTGTRNTETKKDDKLARADRKFIQDAAENGMAELEIAKLAESKASNPDVKNFASTLVKDHTKANDELVQLANSKKVELPAAPPRGKRKDVEKMAKLSGNDFDQRFLREVGVKDHEKDIKKFEKESGKVKDPDLKAWVDKTLPTLREHLAMAQKMPGANASAMGNRGAAAPMTSGPAGGKSGANKTGS
jgi:putative membrane protein